MSPNTPLPVKWFYTHSTWLPRIKQSSLKWGQKLAKGCLRQGQEYSDQPQHERERRYQTWLTTKHGGDPGPAPLGCRPGEPVGFHLQKNVMIMYLGPLFLPLAPSLPLLGRNSLTNSNPPWDSSVLLPLFFFSQKFKLVTLCTVQKREAGGKACVCLAHPSILEPNKVAAHVGFGLNWWRCTF